MAKKSKTKPADAVADTTAPLQIDNVETFLDAILAEYIQVNTVPTGRMCGKADVLGNETQRIELVPLCHFESGCPQNLSNFIETATGKFQSRLVAFEWWARTRLRFSCSTLCCSFMKEVVPRLRSAGIDVLYSRSVGETIRLEDLEIISIAFLPEKRHEITLKYPFLPALTEAVEALQGYPPHCSHNVLCCEKTGIILDMALGQFLGTMQAYIFASKDDFREKFPGRVLVYEKTMERDILVQYSLDDAALRRRISPDATPKDFAKRVLSAYASKKGFCWNCKGIATPGLALMRCTKCHLAMYCGRDCQILHWTSHKVDCASTGV